LAFGLLAFEIFTVWPTSMICPLQRQAHAPRGVQGRSRRIHGLQVANNGGHQDRRRGRCGVIPFRKAVAADVDFLIVHHGMYWDMPRPLTGPAYERVATLVRGNCALYSNHLPLDGHPEIGNNALLAKELGLKVTRPFLIRDGEPIAWIAAATYSRAQLRSRLENITRE